MDPGKEGKMSANFASGCPAEALCQCKTGEFNNDFMARCSIQWTPQSTGTQRMRIEATNTVFPSSADHMNKQTGADTLRIEVIQGEQP